MKKTRMRQVWESTKHGASVLWNRIRKPAKRAFAFLLVAAIVAGAWYAFLALVAPIPIATTPALIMVWASVAVLLLALFPRVLDRIKKVKLKDFELELQNTVARATSGDFVTISEVDNQIFSTKGNFRCLAELLERAARSPDKPVLLLANLRDGDYISIPMLFIYLFFLDIFGSSVTVIFVSAPYPIRSITDVNKRSIVGAVSGRVVIKRFLDLFPRMSRIFDLSRFSPNRSIEEFFRTRRFRSERIEDFFHEALHELQDSEESRNSYLSREDVESWFSSELSMNTIHAAISDSDMSNIHQAINRNKEYLLVLKDDQLSSVVAVCFVAKGISQATLRQNA